jgi:hypothetical protein
MQAGPARSERIDLVGVTDVNGISHPDPGIPTRAMEDLGRRLRLTEFRRDVNRFKPRSDSSALEFPPLLGPISVGDGSETVFGETIEACEHIGEQSPVCLIRASVVGKQLVGLHVCKLDANGLPHASAPLVLIGEFTGQITRELVPHRLVPRGEKDWLRHHWVNRRVERRHTCGDG